MRYVPLFSSCLRTLSSFLLSFAPRSPRQSALSVLLFYCGLPRCCLVSSVSSDLRLFRYLLRIQLRITYASYFLLRTLFSDWLSYSRACPYSITDSAAEFQPHYIYGASHCNVSLVSATQSSVVSSSLLEGNRPLRDFSSCSFFTSFIPLTRVRRDLELSSTRIQGSSALRPRTRVSSPQ